MRSAFTTKQHSLAKKFATSEFGNVISTSIRTFDTDSTPCNKEHSVCVYSSANYDPRAVFVRYTFQTCGHGQEKFLRCILKTYDVAEVTSGSISIYLLLGQPLYSLENIWDVVKTFLERLVVNH